MGRKRKKDRLKWLRIPQFNLDPEIKKGVFIMFVLMIGCISLLGMFDAAGYLGKQINIFLNYAFAWGKWIFPPIMIFWGYALFDDERFELRSSNYVGFLFFMISFQVLLFLFTDQAKWVSMVATSDGGGHFGLFFAELFVKFIGLISTFIVSACLLVISFLLLFDITLINMFGANSFIAKLLFPIRFVITKTFGIFRRNKDEDEEEDYDGEEDEGEDHDNEEESEEEHDEEGEEDVEEEEEAENEDDEDEEENEDEEVTKPTIVTEETKEVWWKLVPRTVADLPLSLLDSKKGKANSGDIENNKEIIRATLENFKIRVEMDAVSVGPTVSQYTFRPADGIKLSKITNLSNDLALALSAKSIRIEAPIPGKPLVGIEVPNETKALVGLKEILSSGAYNTRKNNLMLALGKDVSGEARLSTITKMPHLLVAGATNSGKSVCLNSIIVSLIYQNSPSDLRFIMVDPKRVELPVYNGVPHLLCPVITDVQKTINSLKWCLKEMDSRFNTLARAGKRDIASYNKDAGIKMPYIIFIIDELADLMVTASKDIEGAIIRLAQMSRAVGIHLILATQRPSVDVITGLIKANMPSRIAFSVASGMDSRTILDGLGAENLIGEGDMLYAGAEVTKPVRLQGAYLSDKEIKKVVKYVKKKGGKPIYIKNIIEDHRVKGLGGVGINDNTDSDQDAFYEEAKELVINTGKASATLLQRKLRIGYARAASLMDTLEDGGIIGQANGSKPREILISKEQYTASVEQGVSGASLHDRKEAKAPEEYLPSRGDSSTDEESDTPPVLKSNIIAGNKEDDDDDDNKEEVTEENVIENEENEEGDNEKYFAK